MILQYLLIRLKVTRPIDEILKVVQLSSNEPRIKFNRPHLVTVFHIAKFIQYHIEALGRVFIQPQLT